MSETIQSPICIASPTRRSGTTLLQRLICSSSNALIYGETCANDYNMQASLVLTKQTTLSSSKIWRDKQLERVLRGEVNEWIPDLMPEIDAYLKAYEHIMLGLMDHYGSFALEQGKNVWGMKLPEWNPINLKAIQRLDGNTKIIYLHRGLKDCVRSAKKIEMIINSAEVHQFCNVWKQFTTHAKRQLIGDKVLHLNYEDLIESPEKYLLKIEQFTGAKNIDRSVMNTKVNTYGNDERIESDMEAYLKPSDLSKEELEIVSKYEILN